jgi:hypothetical protein
MPPMRSSEVVGIGPTTPPANTADQETMRSDFLWVNVRKL